MAFLDLSAPSLKICGVTRADDARRLVELGVEALGVNFWPSSKRFIAPSDATPWLKELAGGIVRVGVFVNAGTGLPLRLFQEGLIDIAQLHGDESSADIAFLKQHGVPVIKALGVGDASDLVRAANFHADAVLLDTPAGAAYGGTGMAFDWSLAAQFRAQFPHLPVLLAGGIVPANASQAIAQVRPAALDVASGAELSPGVKDFDKVRGLLEAVHQAGIS